MPDKESPGAAPLPILVAGGLVLVFATVGVFWYRQEKSRPPDVPVLTQEAAAYLRNLQLEDVEKEDAENYLQQTATTITGKITNNGPRTVKLVEIHCVFRNRAGQAILRERKAIIGRRTGAVSTGQTREFSLTFDNIPSGWDRAMPALVIAQIQFQ